MPHQPGSDSQPRNSLTPVTVGIVGSERVIPDPGFAVPAAQAFRGVLFQMGLLHSRTVNQDTLILNPFFGLMTPGQLINPMSSIPDMRYLTFSERIAWSRGIVNELKNTYLVTPIDICFYAGPHLTQYILLFITSEAPYWCWEEPLRGKTFDEAVQWYRDEEPAFYEEDPDGTPISRRPRQ